MNLALGPSDLEFQQTVRDFLQQNLTPELKAAGTNATSVFVDPLYTIAWQKKLHEKGWVAPHWPKEHGGTGWNETERYIFVSECARAGAPPLAPMGLSMVGPCIIGYGTDEQKAFYLPRILSGEDYWCQGYSEPGSGSDLASLSLKAERDGEDYVLNGSKIWTTHAHHANRMFCLVRTSTDGKPQTGITFLLLEMDTPGIKVDPIISISGEHELNQVFFTDARVPVANRLGEENDGWTVAKYLLQFERGGGSSAGLEALLGRIRKQISELNETSDALLARADHVGMKLEGILATEKRVLASLASGQPPGPASSFLKIQRTELMQEIDTLALHAMGLEANVDQLSACEPRSNAEVIGPRELVSATPRYLNDRAGSIYGGSNEVQRNIIAKTVLGL